jgi:hypothetical protein
MVLGISKIKERLWIIISKYNIKCLFREYLIQRKIYREKDNSKGPISIFEKENLSHNFYSNKYFLLNGIR